MEPEPTPTFTASTPALIRSSVPWAVAMFPAINSQSGNAFLILRIVLIAFSLCPWAISTTSTSTPASKRDSLLSKKSPLTPTAAPTNGLPFLSLDAFGKLALFVMSLLVIKPFTIPESSTIGNFSILCLCKISLDSSNVTPNFAVTTSLVITSWILLFGLANSKSLSVTIPINFEFESTTKRPEISLSSA